MQFSRNFTCLQYHSRSLSSKESQFHLSELTADRQKWIYLSLGMVGLTLVIIILQWMAAARTRCPLCITPVLATKACSTSQD